MAAAAVIALSNCAQLIIFVGVVATASGVNAIGDSIPGPSSCNVGGGSRNLFFPVAATATVALVVVVAVAVAPSEDVDDGRGGETAAPFAVAGGFGSNGGLLLKPAVATAAGVVAIVGGGTSTSTFTYVRL